MPATPQQIASARQLAQSRGYNPNLVDADNADRANTAFPSQGGGGYTGGAGYKPSSGTALGPPMGGGGAPTATPGITPPGLPLTGPTAPAGTGSTDALNKVVEPGTSQGGGLGAAGLALSAIGGGGAMGNQENTVDMQSGGVLRPLGMRHSPPMSMQVLQRKAY